jgi:4-amino-4-deoxy-L-arabinose transferase-like glycosyltransferase
MPVTANSGTSLSSDAPPRWGWPPVALVAFLLACLSAAAVWLTWSQGWTLYYGDAEAHLNIARRVLDSRNPGPGMIGTVWLPLPHLLMLPFVKDDFLWRSGLAGAIPSAFCLVIAGAFLFAAVRRELGSSAAGAVAVALFALNPNILYLSAAPMTEPVFFAALAALLYFTVLFRQTQSLWAAAAAGVAAMAGTLTRYEGWFLIPFATLFFLLSAKRNRIVAVILFGAIASFGPLAWMAHDRWYTTDWLSFYRGPYSARAIQGSYSYPGQGDWKTALIYFGWAVRWCAGVQLIGIGALGMIAALARRAFWPVALLSLPGIFYLWSIHSSGTPIFVPNLWHSYYNTRYGLAVLPLAAFGAAALASRKSVWAPAAIVLIAIAPWLWHPRPDDWITWKESLVNSTARRQWTHEAAAFMRANYRPGDGVFTSFSDLTGIFREAGIPLNETLTGDNGLRWHGAVLRPDLMLWEQWAVAIGGDPVQTAMFRAHRRGLRYKLVQTVQVKGAPVIEIYRRQAYPNPYEDSLSESARREERLSPDLEK